MAALKLAVISAGLSQPSTTRMLADKISAATLDRLASKGLEVELRAHDLRDVAPDIMNNMMTGFPSQKLEAVINDVTGADGLIAVTPIFSASYSGLFKSFFDVIDNTSLAGMPVLLGATAGTPRHSLALDFAMRPLFVYLHANVVPTGVFAATSDWGEDSDEVTTLPGRIGRAASELAELVAVSERSKKPADPFGFNAFLSPVGGFQPG